MKWKKHDDYDMNGIWTIKLRGKVYATCRECCGMGMDGVWWYGTLKEVEQGCVDAEGNNLPFEMSRREVGEKLAQDSADRK
jgi:hypothetical protein